MRSPRSCSPAADLLVVHMNVADGLSRRRAETLGRYRDMTLEAGGRYTEVNGASPADALAEAARDLYAARIVVARHRSRLGELVRGSVASQIRRLVPGITMHEVR
jgi:nucleotide-binding universal stress UspA family protein